MKMCGAHTERCGRSRLCAKRSIVLIVAVALSLLADSGSGVLATYASSEQREENTETLRDDLDVTVY